MFVDHLVKREYRLERHGGRRGDAWRAVRTFKTETAAQAAFADAWPDVRQGGLRIFRVLDGVVIRSGAEPTLRTRW